MNDIYRLQDPDLYVPQIAILASGSGTTAEAYAQAIHNGQVNHEIALIISNNPDAAVLDRPPRWNREWGFNVETTVINRETHPGGPNKHGQTREEAEAITKLLDERGIDLVVGLGYMLIIQSPLIETYGFMPSRHGSIHEARALNTHPGPLPLTAGAMGIKASKIVLEAHEGYGLNKSQHTVHVISPTVDDERGIVAAHDVPILPGDTPEGLNQRTQWIEKATIAYAMDKFIRDRAAYLAAKTPETSQ